MATVTRRIEVCDVCRQLDAPIVDHVRLAREGGRLKTYALCDTDLQPIRALLANIAKSYPAAETSRRGSKQVSMEQIEAIKEARKPRRTRKAAVKSA